MYLVVKCRKCGHELYIEHDPKQHDFFQTIGVAIDYICPNCGEESYENWIISRYEEGFPGDEEE